MFLSYVCLRGSFSTFGISYFRPISISFRYSKKLLSFSVVHHQTKDILPVQHITIHQHEKTREKMKNWKREKINNTTLIYQPCHPKHNPDLTQEVTELTLKWHAGRHGSTAILTECVKISSPSIFGKKWRENISTSLLEILYVPHEAVWYDQ